MWPTWKLPEPTSENLNQLYTESKESQITMNVSTDGKNGSTNVEAFLCGMEKLVSSLRKLLRISVFIMRYIKMKVWNRIEGNSIKNSLLVTIFLNLKTSFCKRNSFVALIVDQQRCLMEVFVALNNKKKHSLIAQFGLKRDKYGIIRCYGQYANSDTNIETKNPKLLPQI